MLADVFSNDTGLVAFGFMTIRDILALTFVSTKARANVTGLTRKWKYIRARMKATLDIWDGDHEQKILGPMLSNPRSFISGSAVLSAILNSEWEHNDIDLYLPNKTECKRVLSFIPDGYRIHEEHTRGIVNYYAINRVCIAYCDTGARKNIDILDASIGDPNTFDMTFVQNWLWYDGRLRINDPWAIVHLEMQFFNLAKREVLEQMKMHMWIAYKNQYNLGSSRLQFENGSPLWRRLEITTDRIKKYEKRGFKLYGDLLHFGRSLGELCDVIENNFPRLLPVTHVRRLD